MTNEIWYYQYTILFYDCVDMKEEVRSGVLPAASWKEAAEILEEFYKDELMEIHMLKPIIDGKVFDFTEAENSGDFDFTIEEK